MREFKIRHLALNWLVTVTTGLGIHVSLFSLCPLSRNTASLSFHESDVIVLRTN